MSNWGKSVMTVAAVVRREGDVLLVRERTAAGEMWALPGGVVEPNELIDDAVARELNEETGLVVAQLGRLAFVSQHLSPPALGFDPLTAFGFEVTAWHGDVAARTSDEDVIEAVFVPLSEAVARLALNSFPPSVQPAIAFLGGQRRAGTVWLWEVRSDFAVTPKAVIEPAEGRPLSGDP